MTKVADTTLLKEAIADAKAVREMALKQAKLALEEAFAPQLQSMLTKKIQSEMEGEEEEFEAPEPEVEDELGEDVEVEEQIDNGSGAQVGTDPDHEMAKENSGLTEDEEVTEEVEENLDEALDSSDIGDGDNKEPSKESSETTTVDQEGPIDVKAGEGEKAKENSGLTEDEEVNEDAAELDEIIAELEEEDITTEMEDEDEEEYEEEPEGEEEVEVEIEPEEAPVEEEPPVEEPEAEEEDDEEIDLEQIFREVDEEVVDEEETPDYETRISELEEQNNRWREAVTDMRKQLNEVNILNAKLLFTNKVFRNFNLDNKSKVKVIENFDRAKSVREVKLIYTTLMENMKAEKKQIPNKTQRLVEGASSVVKSTKSEKAVDENEEKIISESEVSRSRIQKLAGIKK